jgi:hypothetical protein
MTQAFLHMANGTLRKALNARSYVPFLSATMMKKKKSPTLKGHAITACTENGRRTLSFA